MIWTGTNLTTEHSARELAKQKAEIVQISADIVATTEQFALRQQELNGQLEQRIAQVTAELDSQLTKLRMDLGKEFDAPRESVLKMLRDFPPPSARSRRRRREHARSEGFGVIGMDLVLRGLRPEGRGHAGVDRDLVGGIAPVVVPDERRG